MSKTKKVISVILTLALVMAMATVAIASVSALEAGGMYVVAGAPELCGSAWDPADTNNQLEYNDSTGVYEKYYFDVPAGTYEFKVTTDGAWDIGDYNTEGDARFGGANAVANVTADGSTVIVAFDGEKAIVAVKDGGVADENGVYVDGVTYEAAAGDTVTYTATLKTPANIEDVQGFVAYGDGLTVKEVKMPLIAGAVINSKEANIVYFNATEVNTGLDFTGDGVLVEITFEVGTFTGLTEISTIIEEMTELNGDSYYTDMEKVNDAVVLTETLEVPDVQPTTVETTPTTVETTPTTVETTPTTGETTPTATKDVQTTATDVKSSTDAGDKPADTVPTGVTATIYVVMAVLVMAAGAVVVLRKKVNG